MQTPALAVTRLDKTFTMHLRGGIELPVISKARFSLHAGTCAVLGGPSGAGKSSILKILYGNYGANGARSWFGIAAAKSTWRQPVPARFWSCAAKRSAMSANSCGSCPASPPSTSSPNR